MRVVHTIQTPWAPYAVTFSRDGTRLAIGGGTWYGGGGIMLVDGRTLQPVSDAVLDLGQPTVSGVCFASDDSHVIATTWQSSQRSGPVLVHEQRDARLVVTARIPSALDGPPTGLALLGGNRALLRHHRVVAADMLRPCELPHDVAGDTGDGARVAIAGDHAVTGDHGMRDKSPDTGALVFAPLLDLRAAELCPVRECRRVTAVACAGDTLWSGGGDGELDAWSWRDGWTQHRLRGAIPRSRPRSRGHLAWAAYTPASIVGICALPGLGAIAVDAGGELCALDPLATWQLPVPGTPRAIAAHPDRPWIAVGLKQGGFADPQSAVAIVEVAPTTLEPEWLTPAVREMARAVDLHRTPDGRFDPYAVVVFRDALEQAGAAARVLDHLRDHDPRLRSCWVVDAVLSVG